MKPRLGNDVTCALIGTSRCHKIWAPPPACTITLICQYHDSNAYCTCSHALFIYYY